MKIGYPKPRLIALLTALFMAICLYMGWLWQTAGRVSGTWASLGGLGIFIVAMMVLLGLRRRLTKLAPLTRPIPGMRPSTDPVLAPVRTRLKVPPNEADQIIRSINLMAADSPTFLSR